MVINPIVGVLIPIIRIPIKGGMTIPNIATFDHVSGFHRLNMDGWGGFCFVNLFPSSMIEISPPIPGQEFGNCQEQLF